MKKLTTLIIVGVMVIGLTACGGPERTEEISNESNTSNTSNTSNASSSESTEVEVASGWPDLIPKEIPEFENATITDTAERKDILISLTFEDEDDFANYLAKYEIGGWEIVMGDYTQINTGTYIVGLTPYGVIMNTDIENKSMNMKIGRLDNKDSALYNYFEEMVVADGGETENGTNELMTDVDPDEVHEGWYDEIPADIPSLAPWPKVTDTDNGLKVVINGLKTGEYNSFLEKFKLNGWDEEKVSNAVSYMTLKGKPYFIVMNQVENYLTMIIGYDYSESVLRAYYGEGESGSGTTETYETIGATDVYGGLWPADAPMDIFIPEFETGQITSVQVTYGVVVHFVGITREEVIAYVDKYLEDSAWKTLSQSVDDTWITYTGQKGQIMLTLEFDVNSFDVVWEIMPE